MRRAKIFFNNTTLAGIFIAQDEKDRYVFKYDPSYIGPPISLTMPIDQKIYEFNKFPPFFDGILPEGPQLEALLRLAKLDRTDYFGQLITVGQDLVGAFSAIEEQI